MKQYIFLLVFLPVVFYSCDRREIEIFKDGNELFFEKFYVNAVYPGTAQADSTIASFFFYPDGTRDIEAPLTVLLSGKLLTEDRTFRLKVVEDATTANPDEYTLDPEYTFHARTVSLDSNDVRDVIKIKLHRSERIGSMPHGVTLVVEVVPDGYFRWGQVERIRTKIILTTATAQPTWWNKEIVDNLLGKYSQGKYKLFLNQVDKKAEMNADLIKNNPDRAIQLTFEFKNWLLTQDPAIIDEDGKPMTVAL